MNPNHVKFGNIFVPTCPETIDEKSLDKALDRLFKEKENRL